MQTTRVGTEVIGVFELMYSVIITWGIVRQGELWDSSSFAYVS